MRLPLFLSCFIALVSMSAHGQTGIGSPLTVSYPEWIAWSQDPKNLRIPTPVTSNAKGLSKDFLSRLELRWEGSSQERLCPDPKLLTRVYRSADGDKATIAYCLRAIDHFREMRRVFELYMIHLSLQQDDQSMVEILDDYSLYQMTVMKNDVLKNDYIAFCTVEFYIFIRQQGVGDQVDCHSKEIVAKYRDPFIAALPTAFFYPPLFVDMIIQGGQYKDTKEISDTYIHEANNDDWHRLWIYPNLHELAHLALCHSETKVGLDCARRTPDHTPGSAEEIAADRWAIKVLVQLFPDNPGEVMGNLMHIVTFQFLSMMDFSISENLPETQTKRLKAMESSIERTYKLLLESPGLSPFAKKQIKKAVKDLQNKN